MQPIDLDINDPRVVRAERMIRHAMRKPGWSGGELATRISLATGMERIDASRIVDRIVRERCLCRVFGKPADPLSLYGPETTGNAAAASTRIRECYSNRSAALKALAA